MHEWKCHLCQKRGLALCHSMGERERGSYENLIIITVYRWCCRECGNSSKPKTFRVWNQLDFFQAILWAKVDVLAVCLLRMLWYRLCSATTQNAGRRTTRHGSHSFCDEYILSLDPLYYCIRIYRQSSGGITNSGCMKHVTSTIVLSKRGLIRSLVRPHLVPVPLTHLINLQKRAVGGGAKHRGHSL